jgi:glycosyltransferase involved in cell wall biosynthesis
MTDPVVSVIVPTRNSSPFLRRCLASIRAQTYSNVELIVVDNHSSDETRRIAAEFADKVFVHGPERSAQVNFGARHATGGYIYKVDADFELDSDVVRQCVECARSGFDAVVVHNTPDTSVSWLARVRKFEVDMYKYDLDHSSARFVTTAAFNSIGGFDEAVTSGEDYDFQNRLNRAGYRTGFVEAEAVHLAEPTKLLPHMRRYYEYGKGFVPFRERNRTDSARQLRFFRRVYLRNARRFWRDPLRGALFLAYHCGKYAFAAAGYFRARVFGRG